MASMTGIKDWAVEYLVHTPCNLWFEKGMDPDNDFALMDQLYENPDDEYEVTGLKCPKCGQVWDLVARNKPA